MAAVPQAASSAAQPDAKRPARVTSPLVKVDHHDTPSAASEYPLSSPEVGLGLDRPPLPSSVSDPPAPESGYASPLRHHKRNPSAQRTVKETLNARVEFEDSDGRTHHRINQYTIIEEIGRGSYGAVHRAVDQYGNEFAVKEFSKLRLRRRVQSHILRQGPRDPQSRMLARAGIRGPQANNLRQMENDDALYLIREEIAVMKKLNHPNLVELIEVLDDPEEDSLFMVLEMCKKGVVMKVGLDDQADPYSEEACRCWFRDLILGIEYLHAQGVIHRDIKPDNLLLSDDDVLKIVDFGVSEMFGKPEDMKTAKSAGSPAFLPPELCGHHGEVSGTAADIWSMGVSLYCLRYGKIPFNRDGMLEIYEAIKTETPELPDDENPEFVDLMHQIMEKDPAKRIQMTGLREHAWVTKGGTDPLLSKDENCEHMVEPPNELELNRAFTRRMNHLLCIMKTIHRFKTLLGKQRSASLNNSSSSLTMTPELASLDPIEEKARAEEIEALLAQRRNIRGGSREDLDVDENAKGHAHDVSQHEPLFLGIGTGATDAFAHDKETPDVVADSPTAVDFNVYDKAYEEAVESGMRQHPSSSRPTMYLTRFVKETEQFKRLENLVDESGVTDVPALKARVKDSAEQLQAHLPSPTSGSNRLANLVAKMGLSGANKSAADASDKPAENA